MSLFITFEGIEGSGKTSHIAAVEEAFKARRLPYMITREPGGTRIGDAVRRILLDPVNIRMTPSVELLLYLACRKQHIEEVIIPALYEGKHVLCDRFEDSSMAYQGYARGLGLEKVKELSLDAEIDLKPDLTILLDLPAHIGLARARGRPLTGNTRFENEQLEFHRAVREGYLILAKDEPERFRVVDAGRDLEEVSKEIVDLVLERLDKEA
jgi:dTMP kinase